LLVRAGTRIGPGAVAALVAGGIDRVTIFKRPAVALLSTGDEVVRAGRELKPGQIYDSNSVVLRELIGAAGGEAIGLGRCPDEPDRLKQAVAQGLEHDVLCIVGGMSKGTHDLVPAVLEELGVRWVVSGLNLKPGKPTRIGRAESGCWVVGLPGNPVSCAVCFLLFAHVILEGLQGLPVRRPPHLRGRTDADLPPNGARPMYQPAEWLVGADGGVQVSPLLWRGSGDPFGLALANALIHRPANAPAAPRGQTVDFVPFDRPR
jgi:molybdopterin molybdotransferase